MEDFDSNFLSRPISQVHCFKENVLTVTHVVTNHDNIGDIVDARKDCH